MNLLAAPWLRSACLGLALSATAACHSPGQNVDALSAVPRANPGTPVLSMQWRRVITDVARDASPQEFASPALRLGATWKEDELYLGSHSGWFYALSAKTGETLWKVKIGSVSSRPLYYRGRIFVGTDDGFVICMDTTGEEQWRYATRAPILQAPVVAEDTLLVANEGDEVYALDLESGTFRWLYKTGSDEEFTLRGHSGLTLDGEFVYAGFADGSLVSLRVATGSVAWLSSLRGTEERFVDVDTTPVIAGDSVVAASSAGGLYSLDKASGRIRWHREVSGGGGLLASDNRIFFVAAEQGIYALDLDGNIIWRQGTRGGGESTEPVLLDDYLYVNLSEDGLFVARADTGEVVQYFDPGYGISGPATVGRRRMFVLSNGAVLYSLGIEAL